jgi:hypothetical protein
MSTEDKKQKIPIRIGRAKDFRYIPATGAWGGVSPHGEIICNFFVEYLEPPESLSLLADEGKKRIQEIKDEGEQKKHYRELQVGIVLRPDIARGVGEWLIKEADKMILSGSNTKQ